MRMRTYSQVLMYIGVTGIFFLDRFCKVAASFFYHDKQLIPDVLIFSPQQNEGIAWGIPITGLFVLLIIALVLASVLVALTKAYVRRDQFLILALLLISVGAFSNLLDRIRFGAVVDYLRFPLLPTANIADLAITAGVVMLAFRLIVHPRRIG